MSIATQITRINNAKIACKTAIESKGVTVPSSATLDDYYEYVDQIETGSSAVLTVSGMKTTFDQGSAFSFGGTVTATIDGVSYDVTSNASFVPAIGTTLSTLGTQTVTVTVGRKSVTYNITVQEVTSYNITITNAGSATTSTSYTSSYLSINNTIYTSTQTLTLSAGTQIKIYGKTGYVKRGAPIFGLVGVKLNSSAVGSTTTTSSTSSYSLLYTYTVSKNASIALIYEEFTGTSQTVLYVTITES